MARDCRPVSSRSLPLLRYRLQPNLGAEPDHLCTPKKVGGQDVHAYTDELSVPNTGANGAWRMKEALSVVKVEWTRPETVTDVNSADKASTVLGVQSPTPEVKITQSKVQVNGTTAVVSITGEIRDSLADLLPRVTVTNGGGDIENVEIIKPDGSTTSFPVTAGADAGGGTWRPFPFKGQFTANNIQVPITGGPAILRVRTSPNAVGIRGEGSCRLDFTPHKLGGLPGGAGGAASVLLILNGLGNASPTVVDHVQVNIGSLPWLDLTECDNGGIESVDGRAWVGTCGIEKILFKLDEHTPTITNPSSYWQLDPNAIDKFTGHWTIMSTNIPGLTFSDIKVDVVETGVNTGVFTFTLPVVNFGSAGTSGSLIWEARAASIDGVGGGFQACHFRTNNVQHLANAKANILGQEYQLALRDDVMYAQSGNRDMLGGVVVVNGKWQDVYVSPDGTQFITADHTIGAPQKGDMTYDGKTIPAYRHGRGLETEWHLPNGKVADSMCSDYINIGSVSPNVEVTEISFPTAGAGVGDDSIMRVTGKVHDTISALTGIDGLLVLVKDTPARVSAGGRFSIDVKLEHPQETVTVTAINAVGGRASQVLCLDGTTMTGKGNVKTGLPVRHRFQFGWAGSADAPDWSNLISTARQKGDKPQVTIQVDSVKTGKSIQTKLDESEMINGWPKLKTDWFIVTTVDAKFTEIDQLVRRWK